MWTLVVLPPSPSPIHVSTPDQSESVPGTSPPIEPEKSNSDSHSAKDSNAELDSENWAYGSNVNQDSSSKAIEDSDKTEPVSPVSPTQIEFELLLELSLSMGPEDSTLDVDPSASDSRFKPISTKSSDETNTGRDAHIKKPRSSPTPVLQFRPANLDLNQPPFRFTFNFLTITSAQFEMDSDDSDSDFDPSASDGTSEPYSDNLSYESDASRDSLIPEPRSFSTPVRWRPIFGNLDLNLYRFTFKPPPAEPSTSNLNSPQAVSPQPEVNITSALRDAGDDTIA
ncbi:uncharacterized protein MELLADRAFT_84589 [Melampsora larici-populina 98AG31]|uniref:Uncharacterized protein n=1 Tax=Melampsora larici-populina (strain 98AG31 / pathotype 3-4-7) TaxID=747676 RepID=F4RG74_MELLP|nr:uncharacterized protein MELLADRAFT_84589 [Melampsora larici-populina 98AG31]EGG08427.1 hypothetical protein MELLADRAFT_84589 [Melampsora larici-populina 98AG31]